ncbi:MAG TPA: hypothetical protein VIQ51_14790 [Chryseosolibacter sp.]
MKKVNVWLFALAVIMMAWACEENDNLDPVGNWELGAPAPASPAADAVITLNESEPTAVFPFEWEPATTTNRFGVGYTFLLVPEGSDDYENPVMRVTPGNAGRERSVAPTAAEIDYALWAACYPAGATVELEWVVVAKAIEKETIATQPVTITRFETEYEPSTLFVYGSGAEADEDVTNATAMRAIPNAEGNASGVYDVYTTLTSGGTYHFRDQANSTSRVYGGADGALEGCGPAITAPETGQYRVIVDLKNNTYELFKIDRWSMVGDAVEGGWGGDVPLAYKGNGVWESNIELVSEGGFVFRANGDWAYLLKRVQGTATSNNKGGKLLMESEAQGTLIEDIPGALGLHTVTLNLGADGDSYSLVEVKQEGPVQAVIGQTTTPENDAVSGNFNVADIDTPDAVFLLSDGAVVAELTKSGDAFSSGKFLALEASKKYTLNTASDGSGDEIVAGDISVARDQAYKIDIDFKSGKLVWKYYNMKLFHWDEAGGGWDARQELVMTYIHPYTFEVTGTLNGGFHSKFNSPWDVQFGTAAKTLAGTMTNGGPNFTGITQNGTYKATIVVSDDYSTAEYTFVKQ